MLTLVLGRAGTGKSTWLLKRIQSQGCHRQQIMLVPEQASYETERRLCEVHGNKASMYAEVFSFTSFEHRVSALGGGLAVPVLDDGGRILTMYAAVKGVQEHLSVLSVPARKPEFLSSLIATMNELKSYCVTPEMLSDIANEAQGLAGKKFQDMALIYGAYDALTARGYTDPRDRLSRLAERLKDIPFAQGKDIYIDGFTDFTPQEELVIGALIRQANSVTVALTCDALEQKEQEGGLFSTARHTAHKLLRMAETCHKASRVEALSKRDPRFHPAISHLEQNLFSPSALPYKGEATDCVFVVSAKTMREEVSWVAGKIRTLLQDGTLRCRDIAVAARDMNPYEDIIESVFSRYEIPVFQSSMEQILQKPVFTLLTSALDILTGNFTYEDVFRYLKTGLSNLSLEECDLLENYVLLWNIRGSKWTSPQGFTFHPNGYQDTMEEKDQLLLKRINEIRCKVVAPFDKIRRNSGDIGSKVLSLYEFLEAIKLPETLEERAQECLRRGEPELALEYRQLWEILCHALEQCVELLGDTEADLEEFSRLLRLLLSQYKVGAIPTSLDRVITGDLPRLSNRSIKALFLLGADDGALPQITPETGLFSEQDRTLLSDYGIQLSSGLEEKLNRELAIVYTACAQPTHCLCVTWSMTGESGSEKQPSFLVDQLRELFQSGCFGEADAAIRSNNPVTLQLMALELPELYARLKGSAYEKRLTRLEQAAAWKRGRLSSDTVHALYGKKIAISPSRLDRYKSCHFAYFLQYGLKAKVRKTVAFSAPEYGTFVHYILEFVLRKAKAKGEIPSVSQEEVIELTEEAVSRYVYDVLGGLDAQTPRFRYLFSRLKRSVSLVVQNVMEELRSSKFQPIFFELGFGNGQELPPVELTREGTTLSISGFVDRVDGYAQDGRLYIKVVDYKTGRKSFDLTEIWNGLGLQMLIYLFALENHGEVFGNLEVVPSGALYLPAQDATISGSRFIAEDERRKRIDKELVRKGLILDEPEIIEAMEPVSETGPRFLPIRVSAKNGKITGDALVSAERLGRLRQHMQAILEDICVELEQGVITADPYWRGPNQNACLYCDYKAACHFEEGAGKSDRRRWIPSVRNSEFWSYLEEQKGEGMTDVHGI